MKKIILIIVGVIIIAVLGKLGWDFWQVNQEGTTAGDIKVDVVNNTENNVETVTLGTQIWMKKNMNVGTMVSGTTAQTNNNIVEKYCYNNDPANCINGGGLYQWNEAMQYSTTKGAQGICPSGYHIPTDNEYKILEIFLGMTQEQADATGRRGTDQGSKLSNYTLNGNNSSGFSAPLSGYRGLDGSFYDQSTYTTLWSSSVSRGYAWIRGLSSGGTHVFRESSYKVNGFSVRCLKD